ncbi:MAG: TlpA disulfide reductase family protein, partial [Bacteroidota bacterium]
APFRFSGVTPEGEILTESSPRFKGKALIVDIMGTWCHNCLDAAPVLQRIAREFGSQGLEVVALSFELGDDTTAGRRNLALFRKRYGITYTLLFCGSTDARFTQPALHDQLNNFYAYPTTLFLDRRGRISAIHAGFRGPGSGQGHQNEVSLLYRKAEELTRP